MILSASQFKTYQRCSRLWWFDKVLRLPRTGGSYGHIFGKVIHAVAERWLEADETGRNLEGERKELYPDGWQTEEGETILQEDEAVVKELINMAISQGVIQRLPDRIIEKSFTITLIDDIQVTGRIDLALPGQVHDHKSTVNMRYALSPDKLSKDTQMLLYAHVQKLDTQPHVTLQHNVFDRTKIRVRKTVVNVSKEEVQEHWEGLQTLAKEMKRLKMADHQPDDFKNVPCNMPDGCNMYGGCSYLSVCVGRETIEHLTERRERLATQ